MSNALLIFATTFFAILKIILTAFGGYVLAKRGIFHKQVTKDMGKVIFSWMVPCMIFGNIIRTVDVDRAKTVALLFLFPVLTHLLAFMLGNILSKILKFKYEEEEYLLVVAGTTFGNHGNIAVPLFVAIVGDPKGPFAHIPNATQSGTAYVLVYMSMCSVIIWGMGMPWFKRRNKQKIEREKAKNVELEETRVDKGEKEVGKVVEKGGEEKHDIQDHTHSHAEPHHESMKVGLLQEDDVGENTIPVKNKLTIKGRFLKIGTAISTSYLFEILTLPPVTALCSSLILSFIPPVRTFLMTTYAQVIPNTAAFVGDASIPIILMFLGSNLADTSKDAYVPKKITLSVTFMRLIMLPILGISLIYLLIRLHLLPDDVILHFLIMIQCAMPSAVNLILACQIAGGGEGKMSSLLFWQYAVCSLTISTFCIIVQFILL